MSTPFAWQGRIDAEETGPSPRWHQRVQPFAATSQGGVALIGFAVDEGVRRNAGRVGAAHGPDVARKALANLPVLCAAQGRAFCYRVLGISRYANTQALFERADALGVRYWLDDVVQTEAGMQQALAALAQELQACDAVYLSIDIDVLPGAVAPGVSAPAPLGVPLWGVERVVDAVLSSGKLVAADLAEFNPSFDRDGLTAKVVARLVARLARGKI